MKHTFLLKISNMEIEQILVYIGNICNEMPVLQIHQLQCCVAKCKHSHTGAMFHGNIMTTEYFMTISQYISLDIRNIA